MIEDLEGNHFAIISRSRNLFMRAVIVIISLILLSQHIPAFIIQPFTSLSPSSSSSSSSLSSSKSWHTIAHSSTRLYAQTTPTRAQQRPFIETIKDGFFPTVGVNDDIEEKTDEDLQQELLEKVKYVIHS